MQQVLDSVGKPIWIALMVIGFIWFWPVGLAVLCYLVWSGRVVLFGPGALGFTRSMFGSGNKAFDDHRDEILKQLEQEREDFDTFLRNLAAAKDKAEFDSFMNARKAR